MALGYHRRTLFMVGSSFLAVVLIGTAYTLSGPSPFSTKKVDAESTHDLLVSYASKDTDSDGLPDWQESLYGTDVSNAHSVNASVTDSEAVAQGLVAPRFASATSTTVLASSIPGVDAGPTTLTDQFAKSLFGQYLKARSKGQPSSADIATFVEQGVAELKRTQVIPDAFNQGQVRVVGTGPDALLSYSASAEKVILQIDSGKQKDEISYYSDAVNKGDTKALSMVQKYAVSYGVAGRALMKVEVPKELASSHLKLANALMHAGESLQKMSLLNSDPIAAMLGIATYSDDAQDTFTAMSEMGSVYTSEGVIPPVGSSGRTFYGMMFVVNKK